MALSNNEKQSAFRARKKAAGLVELRGVWVTAEKAVKLRKKLNKK